MVFGAVAAFACPRRAAVAALRGGDAVLGSRGEAVLGAPPCSRLLVTSRMAEGSPATASSTPRVPQPFRLTRFLGAIIDFRLAHSWYTVAIPWLR